MKAWLTAWIVKITEDIVRNVVQPLGITTAACIIYLVGFNVVQGLDPFGSVPQALLYVVFALVTGGAFLGVCAGLWLLVSRCLPPPP